MTEDQNFSATRLFEDACILRVRVSTTGYMGGDAGHGGKTEIVFEDEGGTIIDAKVDESPNKKITVNLGGDAELRVIIQALRFSADALEKLASLSEI